MNSESVYDIQHMLTNMALWISSKNDAKYFLLMVEDFPPTPIALIHMNTYNYNQIRETLKEKLNSYGDIRMIQYNHRLDAYRIYYRKKTDDICTIMAIPEEKVIEG